MAQKVQRTPHMKISRIIGMTSLLVSALAIGLWTTSRPVNDHEVAQAHQEHSDTQGSSSDIVAYRAIPIIPTTVCSVVKNPSAFVTRTVVFNATVESDCRHLTLLVDTSCNRGLSFTVPHSVEAQWKPIDDAICVGLRPGNKTVRGRFSGRLVKEADRSDGLFPYYVALTAIQDVHIQ